VALAANREWLNYLAGFSTGVFPKHNFAATTQRNNMKQNGNNGLQTSTFIPSADVREVSIQAISISKVAYLSSHALSFASQEKDIKSANKFYKDAQLTVFSHLPSHYTFTDQSLNEAF
jgi:hypothetical protein